MTKTLTEQWREGTLPEGYYYTKGAFDDDIYISHFDYEFEEDKRLPVEEVLAPVPSYDEYKRLQEQLDIVTEQRNDIHIDKQVLQKQLNEANKIIKKLYKESGNPIGIDYLKKWGVK